MPAVAEETEQEREERLAREQDAALAEILRLQEIEVAPPQNQDAPPGELLPFVPDAMTAPEMPPSIGREVLPVTAASTPEEIDAFNARPATMYGPARYTTDSQQYQNELARAQRNNAIDERGAAAAEQAGRRFMGQQKYRQLVADGATPEEALRLAGPDLFFNNPRALMDSITRTTPKPVRASVAPVQRFVPGRVPPAVRAAEDNIKDEITSLRRQITTPGLGGLPIDPAEAQALQARIAQKERERVQLLSDPSFNPNIDQVGLSRMRPAWDAADTPRPAVQEKPTEKAAAKEEPKASPESIREQFRTGKISREEAKKQLKNLGYE